MSYGRLDESRNLISQFDILDDVAATWVYERPVNAASSSGASFVQARQWMLECCESHEACRTSSTWPLLPTRVLDVSPGNGNAPSRLHVACGGRGTYAILSYCWGCPQPFRLTKALLENYRREIPFHKLPKSIQDAVQVTRGLDIRYLWVDSFCIIQDDEDDKNQEIPHMQNYYKNAQIVVLASRASNCEQGFLQPPSPGIDRPILKLPFKCPGREEEQGTVFLRQARNQFSGISDPINNRAWCLQEYVLATRALIYSRAQLFWRCRSAFYRDGGNLSRKDFHAMSGLTDLRLPGQEGDGDAALIGVDPSPNLLRIWRDLITDFTGRHLTDDKDRLSALSGVVAELSQSIGQYLGGLSERFLLHDLMWYLPYSAHRTGLVPSWSWASVSGTCRNAITRPLEMVEVATLKGNEIKLYRDDAPFGTVMEGTLILEGCLSLVTLLPKNDNGAGHADIVRGEGPPCGNTDSVHLPSSQNVIVAGICFFDMGKDREHLELYPQSLERPLTANELYFGSVPIWCFPLVTGIGLYSFGDPPAPMGLLLTQAGNDCYQRVGLFFSAFGHDDFFMSRPWQTIAIV